MPAPAVRRERQRPPLPDAPRAVELNEDVDIQDGPHFAGDIEPAGDNQALDPDALRAVPIRLDLPAEQHGELYKRGPDEHVVNPRAAPPGMGDPRLIAIMTARANYCCEKNECFTQMAGRLMAPQLQRQGACPYSEQIEVWCCICNDPGNVFVYY